MQILLYEFMTSGGWYAHASTPPPVSLAVEGRAMLAALAADFAAIEGAHVEVLRDVRHGMVDLPGCTVHPIDGVHQERESLQRLAAIADWTLIVAPEFDGHLFERTRIVEAAGGRLLGPGTKLVTLASDKHATAEHLASCGVRVPKGVALGPLGRLPTDWNGEMVLKPRDGAGSQGVRRVSVDDAACALIDRPMRLETFCDGTPASVAFLCGPSQQVPLAPCLQRLGGADGFEYHGGSLPIDKSLAFRAVEVAKHAMDALPEPRGYLGVDLVLGDDPSGRQDFVIEINPRVTTSYVGLRALAETNLAEQMIAVASGREVELSWKSGPVQFEATGEVFWQRGACNA